MQSIPRNSFGAQLGASIGEGLGQLAGHKLGTLLKKHNTEKERAEFKKTWGPRIGENAAQLLSELAPEERNQRLGNVSQLMGSFQQPQQQNGLAALANPYQQQQQQQQQEEPQDAYQQLLQAARQQNGPMAGLNNQHEPSQFSQPAQQESVRGQQFNQGQGGQPTSDQIKLIEDLYSTPEQRQAKALLAKEARKEQLELKKIKSAEDLEAWKSTAAYRTKLLDSEQTAIESLDAIKEAQRLEAEGDFPSQAFASFLKGAEWEDVPGFLSGDAEAFNKVLANFQRGVKDVYGGNVSNLEMEQFLKIIPNIYHTPEGRKLIFAGMKKYYKGAKERAKLERQIVKENGGVPMHDLHERVNERFRPIQKDLAKRFKEDVGKAKEYASKTSRAASVLSYGAGSVLGAVPGLLKGAAKTAAPILGGAAAGSLIPGIGTALGAGIGAGGSALSHLMKLF